MELKGLVVGLGNPGRQYAGTRHNIGFLVAELFLRQVADMPGGGVERLSGARFHAEIWRCRLSRGGDEWLVAMPQTFMNLSGDAVQPLLAWHRLDAARLLVIHDELDLPLGRLQFKRGGGAAGHNGLKSIAQRLGTPDFHRLRLGVGKPADHEQTISWVLSGFSPDDRKIAQGMASTASEAVLTFMEQGPERAANMFNTRKKTPDPSGTE